MRCILLLFFTLSIIGCGTVVRGTKQGVKFESEPPGASVTVTRAKKQKLEWHCTSPCELQLSRKRDFDVTFELDGYKPAKARLASRLGAKGGATAIPGNFVLGGGIGFIVDAGTGANMQLKPDPMRAKLAPINSADHSVVYNVRTEGGGIDDVHVADKAATSAEAGSSAPGDNAAPKLKRLPRKFGAKGSPVTKADGAAIAMSDPHGVLITEVDPDGAAGRAGIIVGDVIQEINSTEVSTMDQVQSVVAKMASGETASLTVWRNHELYEAELVF